MNRLKIIACSFCLALCITVIMADLCTNPLSDVGGMKELILNAFQVGVVPFGGPDAGSYVRIPTADSILSCLSSCCDTLDCNVVFFAEQTCYLITCNITWPQGCTSRPNSSPKFKDAYMLSVRSVEDTRYLQVSSTPQPSDSSLDSNEAREEEDTIDRIMGECVESDRGGPPVCLGDHEECRILTDRLRTGVEYRCTCLSGYHRSALYNRCVRRSSSHRSVNATTRVTTSSSIKPSAPSFTNPPTASNRSSAVESLPSPTTSVRVEPLVVSAGENKEIRLPQNDITLFAYVLSEGDKNQSNHEYSYQWSLSDHPPGAETGEMENINSASVKLSKLRAGLYTFKVVVTALGKYGEALVNVSVLSPVRTNKPPVAVVKPVNQKVNQLNDVIIDGSGSTDDDKIVHYHWQQVRSPITNKIDDSDLDRMTLVLKGLVPGAYIFKLTVTDSDGETDSTFANVTVIQDVDYPPQANAGSNVIISLPQNSVMLYGNASTDDKGSIASYEWTLKSENKLTADMQGVTSPFLKLDNLQVGDYTFQLKVTDSAGQSSVAYVSVFVQPENNRPPLADAGADHTVYLPGDKVVLDGRNSTDDQKIAFYQWSLVSGPTEVLIDNADRAVASVSGLGIGVYKFRLKVKDNEALEGSSSVTITVKQNENKPPVANAGGTVTITLPVAAVKINGSGSTDDRSIVSYLWTRDKTSPAAGDIVPNTDHEPILELVNVVTGRYVFQLLVTDAEGLSDTDSMSLIVRPEIEQKHMVELFLASDIHSFTQENKNSLRDTLAVLLSNGSVTPNIVIDKISEDITTGHTYITFYAETVGTSADSKVMHGLWSGVAVVSTLRRKLSSNAELLHFPVSRLDTVVCQSNCSGHGQCDQSTKRCVCDGFWMEDFIKAWFGDQETNCDWSVLYVIIVIFIAVLVLSFLLTGLVCACKRCSRWKPKVKRHRYALLEKVEDDDDDDRKYGSHKHNGRSDGILRARQSEKSSLMASDSEFSSEETIFINNKKLSNGSSKLLPNGVVKPIPRPKVTA